MAVNLRGANQQGGGGNMQLICGRCWRVIWRWGVKDIF
jgi:hypothetical protein